MARLFNDASNQYLEGDGPTTGTPLTLACWFYSDDVSIHQTLIAHYWYNGVSTAYEHHRLMIRGAEAGDPVAAGTQNHTSGYTDATTTTGYSANTWHHAAGVWASSTSRAAYIDGGSKGSDSTSRALGETPNTFSIGYINDASRTSGIQYMSGRIAECAKWNVALTDAEVAILAKGYSPLLVRPQSLVAYWPLASRQSPEIDLVGGYNLTLYNTPTIADHPPTIYDVNSPLVLPDITSYPISLINLRPMQAVPPTSDYATISLRNRHPVLTFEKGYDQYAVFDFIMPKTYSGNGFAAVLHHSVDIATVGSVKAGVSLERIGDGQQDVDSDGFASDNFQYASVPTFTNEVTRSRIRFGDGADIDSIAAGEKCRLKVTRLSDDTAPGAWQLHMVDLRGK